MAGFLSTFLAVFLANWASVALSFLTVIGVSALLIWFFVWPRLGPAIEDLSPDAILERLQEFEDAIFENIDAMYVTNLDPPNHFKT